MRKTEQLNRIRRYIEENPVSAGMVRRAGEWPFSSAGWDRRFRLSDQIR